jgi:uncharacterized protein YbjT (DUF2867 family)
VVSSNPEKQQQIEALGATAAIGSIENVAFLAKTFTGADAVYCMIPPAGMEEPDRIKHYRRIAGNYTQAIQQAGVKRVIHLSSYGAHLNKGTGIIVGAHDAEGIFNDLSGTDITHIRPTYFYYNLYNFIGMIKSTGTMAANYGADDRIELVSPIDIAAAIADEIVTTTTTGRHIRYVNSDECTANEIASVLGAAIGKPDLKWSIITSEQMQKGMEARGLPTILAANLVEMYECVHTGKLAEDYHLHEPAVMGKVKLADFAKDFAATYKQQ